MLKKFIPALLTLALVASVQAAPVAEKITLETETQNKKMKKLNRDYKKYIIAAAIVAAGAGVATALALVNYAPNYCPTALKTCTPDWCIKNSAKIAYLTMEQPFIEAAIKLTAEKAQKKKTKLLELYNKMQASHVDLQPLIKKINEDSTVLANNINGLGSPYCNLSNINEYEFSKVIKKPWRHAETQQAIAKNTRKLQQEISDYQNEINEIDNNFWNYNNKKHQQSQLDQIDTTFKDLQKIVEKQAKLADAFSDNLYEYHNQLKNEKVQIHRLEQTYSDRFRKYKKLQGQEPNPFNNHELHFLIKRTKEELKALPS